MTITLRDLKTEARNLARAGQFAAALAAHDHMLAANPLDDDSRRRIADLLLKLGDQQGALEVYRAVAMHDLRAGHLLPGIVGCKLLASLGQQTEDLVALMAASYAHGVPSLAKFAARQAPVDLDQEIGPADLAAADDVRAVARRARSRALDLSVFIQYPDQFLPVPFFSELPPTLFSATLRMLRLVRGADGDVVIRQGDPGKAFYLVASGEVRVFVSVPGPGGVGERVVERTHLHEGSLFGELALVTDQPRTASVGVVGQADLLEIDRETVARLCAEVPALSERLDRFARERLLKTLLATSPLFKPFDPTQQIDLMRRFEGHEVAAGTVIIREGEAGQGLFVILLGEVEVLRQDPTGHEQPVARLIGGELFGEMSLLGDKPTTATVRAACATTILFLGRDYFQRLIQALPAMRQYFEALSRSRSASLDVS